MTFLATARIGFSQTSIADLVLASALDTGTNSTISSTVVTASISPSANSLLVCAVGARADTQAKVTALTPTSSGLSFSGDWELIQPTPILGTLRWVGCAIAIRKMAASPGTGTITFNWNGGTWNKSYAVNEVTAGFATDLTTYPDVSNTGTSTSLALNLASAPAASSLMFSALAHETSNASSLVVPSGMTLLNDVPQSANLELWTAQKLGSGSQNNTWSGLDTAEGDAGVLVEILQAS